VGSSEVTPAAAAADPVVIGGLGGSGTRLVATIVEDLGFYLGADRNAAGDNLWFTLLLKRSAWHRRNLERSDDRPARRGLEVLAKAMTGRRLTFADRAYVLAATVDVGRRGHDHKGNGTGRWALARARSLLSAPSPPAESRGWGWKEPNSHVYLRQLAKTFPGLRYVHTIRHGLDMAFGPKRGQLYNWGWLYGVDPPADSGLVPRAQLRLWVEANRRAVELGRELLGNRFLLVNFDRLCRHPQEGVEAIAAVAGVDLDPSSRDRLASLPKLPTTSGRYEGRDLRGFEAADLAALAELGFEAPAALPL
jgi:hypothetical protein